MENQLRQCKRCLVRELAGAEETYRSLREYIDNLNPEDKVTTEEYECRLDRCRECDMLLQGTCRKCGCYVELRAILKNKTCPSGNW